MAEFYSVSGVQAAYRSRKRQENRFSPDPSEKKKHTHTHNPAGALILTHWEPFKISDFQKCERIHSCSLMSQVCGNWL